MHEIVSTVFEGQDQMTWRLRLRTWRSFTRAVIKKFRFRFLCLVLVLLCGGLLFRTYHLEGDQPITLWRGIYYTWWLIFGEPLVDLPKSAILDAVVFILPVLGLVVLIETFIELSMFFRDRERSEKEWCQLLASEMKGHVVLVGFGKLGYRTYGLLRKMEQEIVILELEDKSPFLETPRDHHVPILFGDARNDKVLASSNIAKAQSIICCTNDDLTNLEVALDARKLNPAIRVVLRMFDQNLADKIRDGFNIHVAFSTAAMSAPSFAAAASDRTIKSSFMVDGKIIVTSQIHVEPGSKLANAPIGTAQGHFPMSIIAHQKVGEPTHVFPDSSERILPHDSLLVQLAYDDLKKLHTLNKPGSTHGSTVVA